MASVKLVQGDSLQGVSFVIKDSKKAAPGSEVDARDSSTWAVVSLVGAVVSATASLSGDSAVFDTIPCVVANAAQGSVILCFKDTLVATTVGDYEVEVTVTYSGSQQTVYDFIPISVRARHV